MTAGTCGRCGTPLTRAARGPQRKWCSTLCRNAAARARYPDRSFPWTPAERDRFFAKVDFNTASGCWLWTASVLANGYGWVRIRNQRWKPHRLAYTQLVGPIPDGLQLDHLCRVRHCVNPAHLEPVTNGENTRRAYVARRGLQVDGSAPRCVVAAGVGADPLNLRGAVA